MSIQLEISFKQFKKSFKIPLIFVLPVGLKLIPPFQVNSSVFLITIYFEKIVRHMVDI